MYLFVCKLPMSFRLQHHRAKPSNFGRIARTALLPSDIICVTLCGLVVSSVQRQCNSNLNASSPYVWFVCIMVGNGRTVMWSTASMRII